MNLALKDIRFHKAKYLLVELILVLLIFMVLFLSGLASGLGRAVSASIETMNAKQYVLSGDADQELAMSNLTQAQYDKLVENNSGKDITGLTISRSSVKRDGSGEQLSIVYMAVDPDGFLSPNVVKGSGLSDSGKGIVLDTSFRSDGYAVGDTVKDNASGYRFKVVGFAKDAMYSHVAVGFVAQKTYTAMRRALDPVYALSYNAAAVKGSGHVDVGSLERVSKADIVENLPGYKAEQMTITMILWGLEVVSAVILGVFFYILTLQKRREFGLLKAIGMRMREINGMLVTEILILAAGGAVIGNALAFGMAHFLPDSMPFYLQSANAGLLSVVFIVISLLFGAASTIQIAKVDPLDTIGG